LTALVATLAFLTLTTAAKSQFVLPSIEEAIAAGLIADSEIALPEPEVDNGLPYGFSMDLGVGGGIGGDRDLTTFNQAIQTGLGPNGKLGAGVVIRQGRTLIEMGLDAYFDSLSPTRVINTLVPGSLNVEGYDTAFSLAPRLGFAGDIVPGTQWFAGAGGGIAFQSLELRTAGGPVVLSGSATTLMGHLDFGLRQEVAPCFWLGAEGYANFYPGRCPHLDQCRQPDGVRRPDRRSSLGEIHRIRTSGRCEN
jgi:hypothetical protein